jgi:hypothetical protein
LSLRTERHETRRSTPARLTGPWQVNLGLAFRASARPRSFDDSGRDRPRSASGGFPQLASQLNHVRTPSGSGEWPAKRRPMQTRTSLRAPLSLSEKEGRGSHLLDFLANSLK